MILFQSIFRYLLFKTYCILTNKMIFNYFIVVFNVSIILLMTITFSSVTPIIWAKTLKLYQLVELDNPNYDEYLEKEMDTKKEKKLDIFQFFAAAYNFDTWLYGFKGDRRKDSFEKSYRENCESDYRDPNYAINQYYIEKFKKQITNLRKCTNKLNTDEDISTDLKNVHTALKTDENESTILKNVHTALNELFSSQKKAKKIEALDEVLHDEEKRRTFYRCFRNFKNRIFDIKFEKAKYPKHPIVLDIKNDKILTQKEKAKILLDEDLTFLKENKIYKDDNMATSEYLNMLKKYTGYSEREVTNNFSEECEKQLSHLTSINWFFHYTKIFENLRYILDKDEFALMCSHRALFEETNYKIYVMRLVKLGYMPLAEPEWHEEKSATDNENSVAKQELDNRGRGV